MNGSRVVSISLLVFVAVGALVVVSEAVVLDGLADWLDDLDRLGRETARLNENITLQPAPDTPYAFIEENDNANVDGDLSADNPNVECDGVNPTALTGVEKVFHVVYEGDAHVDVWIVHDVEAVSFVGVDGEPIDREENATRLNASR